MELYEHQKKALELTNQFNKVAYYLDMGLGKTYVGSEKMYKLKNDMNIVVCQKSKIQDWIDHFVRLYPGYSIYNLTDKEQFRLFREGFGFYSKKIGVINYDLIFRRPYFLELENFTLMLDESSVIQNTKAKITKYILKMKPKNVILLSGTPSSGKYENLWSQIHLLGWKISEELYNKQYVNWEKENIGGTPIRHVSKEEPYKNVDRLKRKLGEYGAVFMKTEECFDLPKQIEIPINIQTSKEYRKFIKNSIIVFDTLNYTEFHDHSDFEGKDVTPRIELVGDTPLTKRLYARQLCGQYNKQKI